MARRQVRVLLVDADRDAERAAVVPAHTIGVTRVPIGAGDEAATGYVRSRAVDALDVQLDEAVGFRLATRDQPGGHPRPEPHRGGNRDRHGESELGWCWLLANHLAPPPAAALPRRPSFRLRRRQAWSRPRFCLSQLG